MTYPPGPPRDLATWLEQDHEEYQIAIRLTHWCSERDFHGMREIFAQWLEKTGLVWAWTKRPALAEVLEAAFRLRMNQAVPILIFVLSDSKAHHKTLCVVVQHLRWFDIPPDLLPQIQDLLITRAREWLTCWRTNLEARSALFSAGPSLALLHPQHAGQLETWLLDGDTDPHLIGGIAQGLSLFAEKMTDEEKGRYFLILKRLVREGKVKPGRKSDLRAACVAAWGSLCPPWFMEDLVCDLIYEFKNPQGLADVAAIWTARKLIERMPKARDALREQFGDDTAGADRFLGLLDSRKELEGRVLPPSCPE